MTALYVLILSTLLIAVHGYFWDTVENNNDYHPDTVYHSSTVGGPLAACRTVYDWYLGKDEKDAPHNKCYVPNGGKELAYSKPYEVLVREPLKEKLIWEVTTNRNDIMARAAQSCVNCDNGYQGVYVCASNSWGPGKLVIRSDSSVSCYVSYDGKEHSISGYQVLMANPTVEYKIDEVNYYLDALDLLQDNPIYMAGTTFINADTRDQVFEQTLTYSKSSSSEWANSYGFTLGTDMSVTAGIPLFAETSWSISVEQVFGYTYGETFTETIESSLTAQVTVPAEHSCAVSIVARQMVIDVPYDATATAVFPDGTSTTQFISGIYEGLSVSQDTVKIDKCEPL